MPPVTGSKTDPRPVHYTTAEVRTFWAAVGVTVVLVVAGALLALIPGRSSANFTESGAQPAPWGKRVRQRLQQRRPLVLTYLSVVTIAVILLVVWVLPLALTHGNYDKDADRMKARSDVRGNLVTLVGGLGLVGGLAFTARTYRLGQENHRLSREGHITDRYSKAVEQLGDEKI